LKDRISVKIKVYGRVQGVCFRYYTVQKAQQLGVSGWVKNCSDGTLEAFVIGNEDSVNNMVDWCHQGPSQARVDKVTVINESNLNEYMNFSVI
jgi:acylphosphatase